MTIFAIGLAAGLLTAIVYVAVAGRAFLRIRSEILAGADLPDADIADYRRQGRNFGWKAAGGVVVSTSLLALVSTAGWTWYLLPFLAIGTSITVIVAFVLDHPSSTDGS
ncbi:MAG: hypothetical protein QOI36_2029 [Pseudonocardiales bacterium]|jgi:hypothetical protein|nr:hypothetical protein [Pseudonocardiales bacterium]